MKKCKEPIKLNSKNFLNWLELLLKLRVLTKTQYQQYVQRYFLLYLDKNATF